MSQRLFLHADLNSLDQGNQSVYIANKLPGGMMLLVTDHTLSSWGLELEWLAFFPFDKSSLVGLKDLRAITVQTQLNISKMLKYGKHKQKNLPSSNF